MAERPDASHPSFLQPDPLTGYMIMDKKVIGADLTAILDLRTIHIHPHKHVDGYLFFEPPFASFSYGLESFGISVDLGNGIFITRGLFEKYQNSYEGRLNNAWLNTTIQGVPMGITINGESEIMEILGATQIKFLVKAAGSDDEAVGCTESVWVVETDIGGDAVEMWIGRDFSDRWNYVQLEGFNKFAVDVVTNEGQTVRLDLQPIRRDPLSSRSGQAPETL